MFNVKKWKMRCKSWSFCGDKIYCKSSQAQGWSGGSRTSVSKTDSVTIRVFGIRTLMMEMESVSETLVTWTTPPGYSARRFYWMTARRIKTDIYKLKHTQYRYTTACTHRECIAWYKPSVYTLLIFTRLGLTYDIKHINNIQEDQKWI
jgi:hypothetical protein